MLNIESLKSYYERSSTLEVFAYVHDKVEKLSWLLLMDEACRLEKFKIY